MNKQKPSRFMIRDARDDEVLSFNRHSAPEAKSSTPRSRPTTPLKKRPSRFSVKSLSQDEIMRTNQLLSSSSPHKKKSSRFSVKSIPHDEIMRTNQLLESFTPAKKKSSKFIIRDARDDEVSAFTRHSAPELRKRTSRFSVKSVPRDEIMRTNQVLSSHSLQKTRSSPRDRSSTSTKKPSRFTIRDA